MGKKNIESAKKELKRLKNGMDHTGSIIQETYAQQGVWSDNDARDSILSAQVREVQYLIDADIEAEIEANRTQKKWRFKVDFEKKQLSFERNEKLEELIMVNVRQKIDWSSLARTVWDIESQAFKNIDKDNGAWDFVEVFPLAKQNQDQ